MENKNTPYQAAKGPSRSRHYLGGLWTFLATGEETGGKFSLIEVMARKGLEPPRHMHT